MQQLRACRQTNERPRSILINFGNLLGSDNAKKSIHQNDGLVNEEDYLTTSNAGE